MRVSAMFGQTLREAPSDAELASHRLLVRGGFVRQVAAGIYAWLPLGLRVLRRVSQIVREEMDAAGGSEVLLPLLQPADLWKRTGRWDAYGPVLYRITDRSEREFCLAPTHEEMITTLGSTELPSYRDLPTVPYQIQWKFRDEPRARGGLLRAREFLMKDAYSFDADTEGLARTYAAMAETYDRAFGRCGLDVVRIEAQPGEMGGSGRNHEFVQPAPGGEDTFVRCAACGYAANTEVASSEPSEIYDFGTAPASPERVHTPGLVTVAEVASFLGTQPRRLAKSLLYRSGTEIVCVVVPGDREVNEHKLAGVLGAAPSMLTDAEFTELGMVKGFSGPVGLQGVRILGDRMLEAARNIVTGSNEADHHLTGVVSGRDFRAEEWFDLVTARPGDRCGACGGELGFERGIEVGHIFELGTRYSDALDVGFTDASGRRAPYVMGCYGFGLSRTVAAVVEAHHDERGIIWPRSVAPFEVVVVPIGEDGAVGSTAERLEGELVDAGVSVLLDDRSGVSAGARFTDADLIGCPLQIVVGKTFTKTGRVEAGVRASGERSEVEPALEHLLERLSVCP